MQQSVEKALKALLLYNEIEIQKTHTISNLTALLIEKGITLPEKVLDSTILTPYAVKTRYPDDLIQLTEENYLQALEIAEAVYEWVEKQIK